MATTTVTMLGSEGGYGSVIAGALTGENTRLVTVGALANSSDWEFVEWEITIEETQAPAGTNTGTGGSATAGPLEEGGGSQGGALPIDDGFTRTGPTSGPVIAT